MLKRVVFVIFSIILLIGCSNSEESTPPVIVQKDDTPKEEDEDSVDLPEVTTLEVKDVALTTALFGGEVLSNGGGTVNERGIVWSTSTNPTILDNKVLVGSGLGSFEVNQENLELGTEYFIRAFATNEKGTIYGDEKHFTTLNNETSFELNGKVYGQILHDNDNNLVYFFTSGLSIGPNDYRLVSYNYVEKSVVKEVGIDSFFTSATATLHGLGTNNGKSEVYVASSNSISIRDGFSLEELDNFTIPDATRIHCVQQIDNKIYVTYTNSNSSISLERDNFVVFDRNTFQIVSEVPLFRVFSSRFTVVRDYNNPNLINCLTSSNFSSSGGGTTTIYNYIFDKNGIYKEYRVINGLNGDKYPIRTNNNSQLILSGRRAKITDRGDNTFNIMDNNYLAPEIVADYEISPDGNTIYLISERNVVKKINSSTLDVELSITLNRNLRERLLPGQDFNNLIVSDNELIILDFNVIPFEERDEVTMWVFPR